MEQKQQFAPSVQDQVLSVGTPIDTSEVLEVGAQMLCVSTYIVPVRLSDETCALVTISGRTLAIWPSKVEEVNDAIENCVGLPTLEDDGQGTITVRGRARDTKRSFCVKRHYGPRCGLRDTIAW